MEIQRIEQSNEHFTVNALVYTPDPKRDRQVTVLMGHGFSVSKHHLDGLAAYLCYFGFEVINLDFPGHKMGASQGRLQSPSQLVECLQLARRNSGRENIVLLGHSMGAAAAIHAATVMEDAIGLVVLGMGLDPTDRLEDKVVQSTLDWGAMYVDGLDGPEFLKKIKDELLPKMTDVTLPTLVVGGRQDFLMPVREVRKLAETAPEATTTVEWLDSNHADLPEEGKKVIRTWLEQTFNPTDP